MEKTTQTDPEMEVLKGVPGIEDATPKDPEAEKKEEPTKEPEAPEKKEEPAKPEKEEAKADPEPEPEKSARPEKYIPIKQYTSEKREWNESKAQFEKRIADLESIADTKDGSKKSEEAIKSYAEKHGVDEDSVRDLIGIIREKDEPASKKSEEPKAPERSEAEQALIDEAQEIKAEKLFTEEFRTVATPEITNLFPNAKPEQIEAAKSEIEKLACTKDYIDKSLDFIIYKERKALEKFFTADRKGPESGRPSVDKGKSSFSADDFKDGKTPFDSLAELSGTEQAAIIEKMDLKTYEKYMNWVNQNDSLVINRGGRKI